MANAAPYYNEMLPVPRNTIFPVEVRVCPGFTADDPDTWPTYLAGRLEYVRGRLLYMPPCGDVQQDVATSATVIIGVWAEAHPDFVVGSNEAGILLGGDVRGADAAIWRRADLGPHTGGYRRVAPLLAVEVAGEGDTEAKLRDKAAWYLEHGSQVVWLILPDTRELLSIEVSGDTRYAANQRLAEHPELPGLQPAVARFFRQL